MYGTTKKSTKFPQQHAVADYLASMPSGFLDDLFPKIKAAFAPHSVKYNNTNNYIKKDDASKSGTGGTQEQVEWKVRPSHPPACLRPQAHTTIMIPLGEPSPSLPPRARSRAAAAESL